MNLTCQNSQGTRPKIVGQMPELIEQCSKREYKEWEKWYSEKGPKELTKLLKKFMNGPKFSKRNKFYRQRIG